MLRHGMMVVCVCLIGVGQAYATTYYVAASGSDSNAGTSTSLPWQHVSKVISSVGSFAAGDSILFNGGDVWTEQFNLAGFHGSSGNPLTIGSYGNGQPIIDGGSTREYCFDAVNVADVNNLTLNNFECRNVTHQAVTFQTSGGGMPNITVQNFYIHNTGPGAFPGATSSNSCGSSPCDGTYTYANQLDFEDSGVAADGVHFLNNRLVGPLGGHNAIEVHYDTGAVVVQGNQVGPGCSPHGCIDVKGVGNSSTHAIVDQNIAHCGESTGQCYGEPVVGRGEPAFYTEDTADVSYIDLTRNVFYDSGDTVHICGGNCGGGRTCKINVNMWNNTVYATQIGSSYTHYALDAFGGNCVPGGSAGSNTDPAVDARNNIFDGPAGGTAVYVGSLSSLTYDYNDDGGSQGGGLSGVSAGTHDILNINPMYVSASTGDFHLTASSPATVTNGGNPNLVDSLVAMGAFNFVAPPPTPSAGSWSIGTF